MFILYLRASLFMYRCHKDHSSKKSKLVLLENWKRNSVVSMLSSLVTEKFCPNQQEKLVPKTNKNAPEGTKLKLTFYFYINYLIVNFFCWIVELNNLIKCCKITYLSVFLIIYNN